MAAFRRTIPRVTIDEAIAYIGSGASYSYGISIARIMQFCRCSESAARNRIKAAQAEIPGLIEAKRDLGLRAVERRWFLNQEDADAFATSKVPVFDGVSTRASDRSVVQVVTLPTVSTRAFADRPGALDFRQWPSRRGDRLHHQDGRIEPFPGTQSSAQ